uniref:F5/8 type C domain-containing protein n=1 Tax=Oryzias sinensis TaxID=183150 RepID=A0A8C7XLF3_9TELE
QGILPRYRKFCDNRPFCFVGSPSSSPSVSSGRCSLRALLPVCLHGLGMEDGTIPDAQLSASSSIGAYTPSKARLNGDFCWKPSGSGMHASKSISTSSWIQVNLGLTRKVTGIVIQGCGDGENWITKFKIQHSLDGISWKDYTADGDTQLLGTPVSTQFLRILPLEFKNQAGLRFEVLGCTPDCEENTSRTLLHKLISDASE